MHQWMTGVPTAAWPECFIPPAVVPPHHEFVGDPAVCLECGRVVCAGGAASHRSAAGDVMAAFDGDFVGCSEGREPVPLLPGAPTSVGITPSLRRFLSLVVTGVTELEWASMQAVWRAVSKLLRDTGTQLSAGSFDGARPVIVGDVVCLGCGTVFTTVEFIVHVISSDFSVICHRYNSSCTLGVAHLPVTTGLLQLVTQRGAAAREGLLEVAHQLGVTGADKERMARELDQVHQRQNRITLAVQRSFPLDPGTGGDLEPLFAAVRARDSVTFLVRRQVRPVGSWTVTTVSAVYTAGVPPSPLPPPTTPALPGSASQPPSAPFPQPPPAPLRQPPRPQTPPAVLNAKLSLVGRELDFSSVLVPGVLPQQLPPITARSAVTATPLVLPEWPACCAGEPVSSEGHGAMAVCVACGSWLDGFAVETHCRAMGRWKATGLPDVVGCTLHGATASLCFEVGGKGVPVTKGMMDFMSTVVTGMSFGSHSDAWESLVLAVDGLGLDPAAVDIIAFPQAAGPSKPSFGVPRLAVKQPDTAPMEGDVICLGCCVVMRPTTFIAHIALREYINRRHRLGLICVNETAFLRVSPAILEWTRSVSRGKDVRSVLRKLGRRLGGGNGDPSFSYLYQAATARHEAIVKALDSLLPLSKEEGRDALLSVPLGWWQPVLEAVAARDGEQLGTLSLGKGEASEEVAQILARWATEVGGLPDDCESDGGSPVCDDSGGEGDGGSPMRDSPGGEGDGGSPVNDSPGGEGGGQSDDEPDGDVEVEREVAISVQLAQTRGEAEARAWAARQAHFSAFPTTPEQRPPSPPAITTVEAERKLAKGGRRRVSFQLPSASSVLSAVTGTFSGAASAASGALSALARRVSGSGTAPVGTAEGAAAPPPAAAGLSGSAGGAGGGSTSALIGQLRARIKELSPSRSLSPDPKPVPLQPRRGSSAPPSPGERELDLPLTYRHKQCSGCGGLRSAACMGNHRSLARRDAPSSPCACSVSLPLPFADSLFKSAYGEADWRRARARARELWQASEYGADKRPRLPKKGGRNGPTGAQRGRSPGSAGGSRAAAKQGDSSSSSSPTSPSLSSSSSPSPAAPTSSPSLSPSPSSSPSPSPSACPTPSPRHVASCPPSPPPPQSPSVAEDAAPTRGDSSDASEDSREGTRGKVVGGGLPALQFTPEQLAMAAAGGAGEEKDDAASADDDTDTEEACLWTASPPQRVISRASALPWPPTDTPGVWFWWPVVEAALTGTPSAWALLLESSFVHFPALVLAVRADLQNRQVTRGDIGFAVQLSETEWRLLCDPEFAMERAARGASDLVKVLHSKRPPCQLPRKEFAAAVEFVAGVQSGAVAKPTVATTSAPTTATDGQGDAGDTQPQARAPRRVASAKHPLPASASPVAPAKRRAQPAKRS